MEPRIQIRADPAAVTVSGAQGPIRDWSFAVISARRCSNNSTLTTLTISGNGTFTGPDLQPGNRRIQPSRALCQLDVQRLQRLRFVSRPADGDRDGHPPQGRIRQQRPVGTRDGAGEHHRRRGRPGRDHALGGLGVRPGQVGLGRSPSRRGWQTAGHGQLARRCHGAALVPRHVFRDTKNGPAASACATTRSASTSEAACSRTTTGAAPSTRVRRASRAPS
jgi:hypothetical protein